MKQNRKRDSDNATERSGRAYKNLIHDLCLPFRVLTSNGLHGAEGRVQPNSQKSTRALGKPSPMTSTRFRAPNGVSYSRHR